MVKGLTQSVAAGLLQRHHTPGTSFDCSGFYLAKVTPQIWPSGLAVYPCLYMSHAERNVRQLPEKGHGVSPLLPWRGPYETIGHFDRTTRYSMLI